MLACQVQFRRRNTEKKEIASNSRGSPGTRCSCKPCRLSPSRGRLSCSASQAPLASPRSAGRHRQEHPSRDGSRACAAWTSPFERNPSPPPPFCASAPYLCHDLRARRRRNGAQSPARRQRQRPRPKPWRRQRPGAGAWNTVLADLPYGPISERVVQAQQPERGETRDPSAPWGEVQNEAFMKCHQ